MKTLLTLSLALLSLISRGQLSNNYLEETPLSGVTGDTDFTGYTQYRIFAQMVSPDDKVTGVYGDINCPVNFSTSTEFYKHIILANFITNELNGAFAGIVPEHIYQSLVSIGGLNSMMQAVPYNENTGGFSQNNDLEITMVNEGSYAGIGIDGGLNNPGPSDLWTDEFLNGGNIQLQSYNGGGYFNTPDSVNCLGVGVNNSICLGNFTTTGQFSYNLGLFTEINGTEEYISWCNSEVSGLSYYGDNCNDQNACNYNPMSFSDSGCVYPSESCDDLNPYSVNDTYQEDCTCAGIEYACLDNTSYNYNSLATLDCSGVEGGTDYSCCTYLLDIMGDANGGQVIDVQDLTILLELFGTFDPPDGLDFNGDGALTAADIVAFLSVFGTNG